MVRVPRAVIDTLHTLVAQYFREVDAAGLTFLKSDFEEHLAAAVTYARALHPLGDEVVTEDPPPMYRFWWNQSINSDLHGALFDLDDVTPEAVVATLVVTEGWEVVDVVVGRRSIEPHLYNDSSDLPDALGPDVHAGSTWFWMDCSFRVVAEGGWLDDRARRRATFAAIGSILPRYRDLSFVEIGRGSARRLARALFAGPPGRHYAGDHDTRASALVTALGPRTRAFANRDLSAEQLDDPFAHGEVVDLGSRDQCAGGHFLALIVSDGRRLLFIDALWNIWSE